MRVIWCLSGMLAELRLTTTPDPSGRAGVPGRDAAPDNTNKGTQ